MRRSFYGLSAQVQTAARASATRDPICPTMRPAGLRWQLLRVLGEDVAEMLEDVRACFKVICHVRPKLSCDACDRIVQASISPASMVSSSVDEGDVVLGGGLVVCCELGLVLATGFCELTCCACWLDSGTPPAIVLSCPRQQCHAGKTAKPVSDSRSDLSMTLIAPSPDGSVGPE
jgi:hypothetical protein